MTTHDPIYRYLADFDAYYALARRHTDRIAYGDDIDPTSDWHADQAVMRELSDELFHHGLRVRAQLDAWGDDDGLAYLDDQIRAILIARNVI